MCSRNANSYAPVDDSESKLFALAVSIKEVGAMTKRKGKKCLAQDEGKKRLDVSKNVSHNRLLSNRCLIQLVKFLARQAAKEDYEQSLIPSKSRR
jgi:predicted DNA-binding protein (UPF0251 family)